MKEYSGQVRKQQHKLAKNSNVEIGDIVMAKIHVPIANSNKLSPRFTGPFKIIEVASGNKYKVQDINTGETSIRHVDDLKKVNMTDTEATIPANNEEQVERDTQISRKDEDLLNDHNENHEYKRKLRSYTRDKPTDMSGNVLTVYSITEELLEEEFYDYVQDILDELGVDCNSFYR